MTGAIPAGQRLTRYAVLVACALIAILGAAMFGVAASPRVFYLCALAAICASPVLYVEKLNGPYSMLYLFMAIYFIFFGANDVLDLVVSRIDQPTSAGLLTPAEIAILAGGSLVVIGYRRAIGSGASALATQPAKDWSSRTVLVLGLLLWAIGARCQWIWQVNIESPSVGIQSVGPAMLTAITAGRLVHPLGLAMLAYAFVHSRSLRLAPLMLAIVSLEFVLGFIEDSKELAMQAGIILLAAKYFLDARIPKTWLIAALIVVVVSFPVFQAYRYEVLAVRGTERAQAAQDFGKSLDLALNSSQYRGDDSNFTSRSFLARISYKPIIELTIARVGTETAFQHGNTIAPLLYAFLPRYFFPNKTDSSVGQLFNRQLHIAGNDDTYISPTFFGEFYWNFGWSGIVIGSLLFGYLLGFINRRCDLSEQSSVTRFLILIVSVYLFCARFEDGIAISLTVWLRSVAAIGILHLIFARVPAERVASDPSRNAVDEVSQGNDSGRQPFPHLLR